MVDDGNATVVDNDHRPRVALAHDWLCGMRGGEAVLDEIAAIVRADYEPSGLYTMFNDGRDMAPNIDAMNHRVSALNRVPCAPTRLRRWLLPLYPWAVGRLGRQLRADHAKSPIDLLVSTSSAAIKGLRPPRGVPHLCYCHAPARYVWSIRDEYGDSPLRAVGLSLAGPGFRRWDRRSSANVTRFLANSRHTAAQVERCFGREAEVVYPPVLVDRFTPGPEGAKREGWLVVTALEPYKRVDLAIDAAKHACERLTIIGKGSCEAALRAMAGPTVRFLGHVPDANRLVEHYRRARLLLFPQIEDFGIVAVEAQACGLPVVARRAGGALETVIEGRTGAFFDEPTPEAVVEAAGRVPEMAELACRANAERFSVDAFRSKMRAQMQSMVEATIRA